MEYGKGSKNSSSYFDNKMIEEEEMEKQVNDGTFDECAYVNVKDQRWWWFICLSIYDLWCLMYDQYCILCNLKNNKKQEKMN